METSRLARSVALASFLGTASLVGGAAFEAAAPEDAEASYEVDESYFYTSLAAHGSWVQNAEFGWVWYPTHRAPGWQPYTVGRWAWTDYDEWMWVSDEPYGWATYHYGRWYLDPFYGWVWIPGRVWAPAWVSWRDCDDYIGWAPLGPWGYWDSHYRRYRDWDRWDHRGDHHGGHHGDHDWDHDGDHDGDHDWNDGERAGRGQRGDNHHDYARDGGDDRDSWNFTRKRDFDSARVDKVVLDRGKLPAIYDRSRPLPPPSEQDERAGRGTTRAVDKQTIERASGRPVRTVRVEDDKSPPARGGAQASSGKNGGGSDRVRVFRPNVKERSDAPTPDKLGIAKAPDRNGRSGRGSDARSSGGPQANNRQREHDTGGYERPARADERGGYERPVRDSERGDHGRPVQIDGRKGEKLPVRADSSRGEAGQAQRGGTTRLNPQRDASQPRGHPVPQFENTPRKAEHPSRAGSPTRSAYDAPTVDQRRSEPRMQQTPASRGPVQQHSPSPGMNRGSSPHHGSPSPVPQRGSYSPGGPPAGAQRGGAPHGGGSSGGGGSPGGGRSSGGGHESSSRQGSSSPGGHSGGSSHGGGSSSQGGSSQSGASHGGGYSGGGAASGGGGGRGMSR